MKAFTIVNLEFLRSRHLRSRLKIREVADQTLTAFQLDNYYFNRSGRLGDFSLSKNNCCRGAEDKHKYWRSGCLLKSPRKYGSLSMVALSTTFKCFLNLISASLLYHFFYFSRFWALIQHSNSNGGIVLIELYCRILITQVILPNS